VQKASELKLREWLLDDDLKMIEMHTNGYSMKQIYEVRPRRCRRRRRPLLTAGSAGERAQGPPHAGGHQLPLAHPAAPGKRATPLAGSPPR
jgi:hypothetical protein